MMEYEFAPIEGITDAVFRRNHRKIYPGIARYYTPFISPTQNHVFTPRDLRELNRENNPDLMLIPQLLTKNAADFLWAAEELAAMGYEEIDLNLGCPSGTVTAKGKGAGMLAHPEALDRFLEEIFSRVPVRVSVKTRLGISDPEEFPRLLKIYARYPLSRLIIHVRTRDELYCPGVHTDTFEAAIGAVPFPLCYNGDLFTPEACSNFSAKHPGVDSVMLGRGLIADPALVSKLTGGPEGLETLHGFHAGLCQEYPVVFGSKSSAAHRMKAVWHYLLFSFQGGDAYRKRLIKSKNWEALLDVTEEIFDTLPLLPQAEGVQ